MPLSLIIPPDKEAVGTLITRDSHFNWVDLIECIVP